MAVVTRAKVDNSTGPHPDRHAGIEPSGASATRPYPQVNGGFGVTVRQQHLSFCPRSWCSSAMRSVPEQPGFCGLELVR